MFLCNIRGYITPLLTNTVLFSYSKIYEFSLQTVNPLKCRFIDCHSSERCFYQYRVIAGRPFSASRCAEANEGDSFDSQLLFRNWSTSWSWVLDMIRIHAHAGVFWLEHTPCTRLVAVFRCVRCCCCSVNTQAPGLLFFWRQKEHLHVTGCKCVCGDAKLIIYRGFYTSLSSGVSWEFDGEEVEPHVKSPFIHYFLSLFILLFYLSLVWVGPTSDESVLI